MKQSLISVCSALMFFASLNAQNEEQTIKQRAEAYVEAINRRDAHAISTFWAEDGEYVSPDSGETVEGREAIENAFKERFQSGDSPQIDIKINTVEFPTAAEAIVTGTLQAASPNLDPLKSAFKAYFTKANGNWLIEEVRDVSIVAATDHYQYLKELEWLIGDWIDADDDVEIHLSYKWDTSKNFIIQQFSVTTIGTQELEGTSIIGWDPIKKRIRSWLFDTDGTFGESIWIKRGNNWVVESAQTLADGSRASSVNVYTPIDSDRYKFESTGREVGGKILPDIEPVIILRKKGE